MPRYRPDIEDIPRYVPGRPIEEVARELGISHIDKLASNEHPGPPFPAVVEAIAAATGSLNRYPDSGGYDLTRAIAAHHDVPPEAVWIGAGSSEVLRCVALSVGGPGTSAVFASPSFVMYPIGTMISGSTPIPVPLDGDYGHDLDAMLAAIQPDTTVVYVCNPNNPTGGCRSAAAVSAFIDEVPDDVTVVVDEAYFEYVTDPEYGTMRDVAIDSPNVLVTRTFAKVYGLAGLRVGYGIGNPDHIAVLRTPQAPFSVTTLAQVAAIEALRHTDEVAARADANAVGRARLFDGLTALGIDVVPSQTNFVYFEPDRDPSELSDALTMRGSIVRVLGPGVRVTVGTPEENTRFLSSMEELYAQT